MQRMFDRGAMPGGRVRLGAPVWFIRHGRTDWNAERRFQGHADIPLNDDGRAQAARNGLALARAIGAREIGTGSGVVFVTSPLSRARETLEIMRGALRLPARRYAVDDRLIEIDLGDWNGKTPAEIEAESPGAFAAREADKWGFAVPGGESYAAAAARTREFLLTLKGPAVIVGHGAAGRLLRGYLTGMKRDAVPHLKARQDVVYELAKGREREI